LKLRVDRAENRTPETSNSFESKDNSDQSQIEDMNERLKRPNRGRVQMVKKEKKVGGARCRMFLDIICWWGADVTEEAARQ
jgi:hypothetical protein